MSKGRSYSRYGYVLIQDPDAAESRTGTASAFSSTSDVNMLHRDGSGKGSRRLHYVYIGAGLILVAAIIILGYLYNSMQGTVLHAQSLVKARQTVEERENRLNAKSVIHSRYEPNRFNGTWITDNEILMKDAYDNIVLFRADTLTSEIIGFNHTTYSGLTIVADAFDYHLSADKKYLMIAHSYHKLYRYSFFASYVAINIESQELRPIVSPDGIPLVIQTVVWSPVGNGFAYVFSNNIYYRKSVEDNKDYQLTNTGRINTVYTGIPDWVYEEEVLSSSSALWFSPSGRNLAYASFDDNRTMIMTIPFYGNPGHPGSQYTQAINLRYPKPGRVNPVASLNVVDLSEIESDMKATTNLPAPTDLREPVLSGVNWANESVVAAWVNRVQNSARITRCSVNEGVCDVIFSRDLERGWFEPFDHLQFSSDGKKMLMILSHSQEAAGSSPEDTWDHLTYIDLDDKGGIKDKVPLPLTSGMFTVTEILAWDEKENNVYFLSTQESPTVQHMYRLNLANPTIPPVCMTCDLMTSANQLCRYSGASFSINTSFYVLSCIGPGVPEITLFDKSGKQLLHWDTNEELRSSLANIILPTVRYMTVPIGHNMAAQVKLFLPPGLDETGSIKYPLLIHVYGGPSSFQVTERFSIDWNLYLADNKDIVVAYIDGRNSALKGNALKYSGYRRLGTVEIYDQINVTRYLQENLPYIDKTRTAIWGWSYGGYATGLALALDPSNVFKCGISVAPVTDWIYYDTIYSERYMGLPTFEDNLEGYKLAALNNKVENIRNKQYLLVHGTMDDNVHFQQSMMLAKSLQHADILFQTQTYPDEEHGLIGVRPHFYHTLERFLDSCFA
uniref:Venom dipeptidyl peptidase 4 n=1 Tax=Cacopsylla melanoneura TaxID=428564 RepID=A0A8D8Q543_9HEMI